MSKREMWIAIGLLFVVSILCALIVAHALSHGH
jgi:hypothetical protein